MHEEGEPRLWGIPGLRRKDRCRKRRQPADLAFHPMAPDSMMLETSCQGFNWAYDAFSQASRTRMLGLSVPFSDSYAPSEQFYAVVNEHDDGDPDGDDCETLRQRCRRDLSNDPRSPGHTHGASQQQETGEWPIHLSRL